MGKGFLPHAPHRPLPLRCVILPAPSCKVGINFWEGGTQVLRTDLTLKTQEPLNNEGSK